MPGKVESMHEIRKETREGGIDAVEAALRRSGGTNVRRVTYGRTTHVIATLNGRTELFAVMATSRAGGGLHTRNVAGVAQRVEAHAAKIKVAPYIAIARAGLSDVRWAAPRDVVRVHDANAAVRAAAGATATLIGAAHGDFKHRL